ncbi:protein of unknown function [Magnetospirillum gryphiswaldense MSR-1 v2]|uniref:Uncharacterized protein n=1 Tax=Magnetospirillum gryphiswaldense (strain DSM 6361 / JCM 21280 / NBRC 15271 / MSR-1) TaxID=431944 RepID=V6F2X8_MAGGM|nr:protein of unknown function [Magnetospirillum gryphiswaldense MSR-1 v2]
MLKQQYLVKGKRGRIEDPILERTDSFCGRRHIHDPDYFGIKRQGISGDKKGFVAEPWVYADAKRWPRNP